MSIKENVYRLISVVCVLMISILACDEPLDTSIPPNQTISITVNEFMASNTRTITDEMSDYDDWIELYNKSDSIVQLRSVFVTDDLNVPTRWQMPDTFITPHGFLILWADGEPQEGRLHTNFRLEQNGEQIGIFHLSDGSLTIIDSLTFGLQTPDTSFGRFPDGGSQWKIFSSPTPGQPNQ